MAKEKKVVKVIKLQIAAGKANPAPPIGPALGAAQVNIMAFCKEFNARTQKMAGDILPVEISVYADKSFTFITKKPPMSVLIKQVLKLEKGSPNPNRTKVATMTMQQVDAVLEIKKEDLRMTSERAGRQLVLGTARSMGIEIKE